MKYIDADKLIAILERQNADKKIIQPIIHIIDSLQQKQPVEGLEEEITRTYHDGSVTDTDDIDHTAYENIARHFAEWMKAKILKIIESRISEIIGDAQPNPVLRLELQGIIDKIK